MKKIFFLTSAVLFLFMFDKSALAQSTLFSGNLSCTINGSPWNGTVSTALYDPKVDFLTIAFDASDNSQLKITFKPLAEKFSGSLPQIDSFDIHQPSLSNRGAWFYIQFAKNKNDLIKSHEMSKAIVKVNKSDVSASTIQIEFTGEFYIPELEPNGNLRETDVIRIENAATDDVKYMTIK
ncbi:MAG: hypothetical protein JNK43_00295 [Ignavibacteria bacterium]|nr:hypothetical protein [Ignavibacteria bacterium]